MGKERKEKRYWRTWGLTRLANHYYREVCRGKQGEDGVIKGHRTTAWKEEERKISIFNSPTPTRKQRARKSRCWSPLESAPQSSTTGRSENGSGGEEEMTRPNNNWIIRSNSLFLRNSLSQKLLFCSLRYFLSPSPTPSLFLFLGETYCDSCVTSDIFWAFDQWSISLYFETHISFFTIPNHSQEEENSWLLKNAISLINRGCQFVCAKDTGVKVWWALEHFWWWLHKQSGGSLYFGSFSILSSLGWFIIPRPTLNQRVLHSISK